MGVLTVTIGTASTQFTRNRSIANADFTNRILPALKYEYGEFKDGPGGPTDPIAKTNAELADDFFNQVERYLLNVVRRYEKAQAEQSVPIVSDLPLS